MTTTPDLTNPIDTAAWPDQPDVIDLRDPFQRIASVTDDSAMRVVAHGDGVVAGSGLVHGVPTVIFATDSRQQGGALGFDGCAAIVDAYHFAMDHDMPIVGIWHSGGARLAEGAESLHAVGSVFAAMTMASGVVPQISIVLGAAAGGAAYGPALTDIVILGPGARVFVTGPDIVNRVTGEEVDAESLGGPRVHSGSSGLAHVEARDDEDAIDQARSLIALLRVRRETLAQVTSDQSPDPARHVPSNVRRAYDVRPLVGDILDGEIADGGFVELHKRWAPNIVTGFGRIEGMTVGVIANNPIRMGGCLNASASEKAARFVRICDSFGIPLVVVVDVPGYLPGGKQEANGIIRRGAKLLHAFAAASVPRFTVITGKAYGGAYIAMNSRSLGASEVMAWPQAAVDVMSAESAVRITHRRELAALPAEDRDSAATQFANTHEQTTGGLARAVEKGFVDRVIEPQATRSNLAAALRTTNPSRSQQKNIPL